MILEKTDRQIDNNRVRVTRHRMVPGAHTGRHRHAHDYVIVPVTDGRMRLAEGGRESTAELAAGVTIAAALRRGKPAGTITTASISPALPETASLPICPGIPSNGCATSLV
jgi:hypothetical protein